MEPLDRLSSLTFKLVTLNQQQNPSALKINLKLLLWVHSEWLLNWRNAPFSYKIASEKLLVNEFVN